MSNKTSIMWFRQDLRIKDNPALIHAATSDNILPIYILDDANAKSSAMGAASRWWLHHSLNSLNHSLGGNLSVYQGDAREIIKDLTQRFNINKVCWNRCYEPWRTQRDAEIKEFLTDNGIEASSHNGSLLWEPWQVKKPDGTPYKVFTPFYKKGCQNAEAPRQPLPAPQSPNFIKDNSCAAISSLNLLPKIKWDEEFHTNWQVGEFAATTRLSEFLSQDINNYKQGRDFPALRRVSRLSPHLHFGEISPNQVWHAALQLDSTENTAHFCSELAWREFSHSLLFYNPNLPTQNLQTKFNQMPWVKNDSALSSWQQGQTGIPIVDAGMRELWQTGYMHNRVRMIVGSFLVKNLLLDWRHGERWFWDCLLDADLANNSASWQWIAGCGADAAPYFRVFNPVTQAQKFDPDGEYISHYVPELADLPAKHIAAPWLAPKQMLEDAGIDLGSTYPFPIVDLKESREEALAAFKSLST